MVARSIFCRHAERLGKQLHTFVTRLPKTKDDGSHYSLDSSARLIYGELRVGML